MLENALREKVTPFLRSQSRWRRWAARGDPQYRAVFHTLRRNRRYGRWSGSGAGRWHRHTRIKNVPRRAAGPDIRHIIIGNEGVLCYITEVTVKIFKFTPENNLFYGYILEDMKPASTSCVKSWWKGTVRRLLVCRLMLKMANTSPILPTANAC